MSSDDWRDEAACRGAPTELFYPAPTSSGTLPRNAYTDGYRLYCRGCEVRAECEEAGRSEPWGMWGGLSPTERSAARALERRRHRIHREAIEAAHVHLREPTRRIG